MKRIALLGSTGSIGRQTLEVVETMGYTITALTANRSVELLEAQCRKFRPRLAVCMDPEAAETLKTKLADTCVEVRCWPLPGTRIPTWSLPPLWEWWGCVPLWRR